ncbi:MAG TPA: hypothetical protein VF666_10940 [Pyrinomonadaceae bacterium]
MGREASAVDTRRMSAITQAAILTRYDRRSKGIQAATYASTQTEAEPL